MAEVEVYESQHIKWYKLGLIGTLALSQYPGMA